MECSVEGAPPLVHPTSLPFTSSFMKEWWNITILLSRVPSLTLWHCCSSVTMILLSRVPSLPLWHCCSSVTTGQNSSRTGDRDEMTSNSVRKVSDIGRTPMARCSCFIHFPLYPFTPNLSWALCNDCSCLSFVIEMFNTVPQLLGKEEVLWPSCSLHLEHVTPKHFQLAKIPRHCYGLKFQMDGNLYTCTYCEI